MKKSTQWAGVFAMGIISAAALSGCASADPATTGGTAGAPAGTAGAATAGAPAGTAGAAPTAGAGTGGSSGAIMGTQLASPMYYTYLTGADATAGAAAPASFAVCGACHGATGVGTSGLAPEIRFTPKDYAVAIVRNGRKTPAGTDSAMTPYPASTVSDADLDAINTWLNSFPKPTTGQGLYKAMCGNCHGPNAPTGGSAPVSIQGKSKAQVAMLVRNGFGTDVTKRAEYMPKYDATLLTDADLALIETYLGSQ